jgi:hypothetical protein
MLEPKGPNNRTPEETGWPVYQLDDPPPPEGFTRLEPAGAADPEESEFLAAVERSQQLRGRPAPFWREVFALVKGLGYRKDPAPPAPQAPAN